MSKSLQYPHVRRQDVVDVYHGTPVEDPYRWLEEDGTPALQAFAQAQDALARGYLEALPARERLRQRLRQLYFRDAAHAPLCRSGRYFYRRTLAAQEKPLLYWREGHTGEERLLLDLNALSADGSLALGTWVPSPDGRKLAFTLAENNADACTLYILDVDTGVRSPVDVIADTRFAVPCWTPDSQGFYYTWLDPAHATPDCAGRAPIRYHRLGTSPDTDLEMHPASGDSGTFLVPELSPDGRWLFARLEQFSRCDYYFRDLLHPEQGWQPLLVGAEALTEVFAWQDVFYLRTSLDAPCYRLLRAPAGCTDPQQWQEVIPEQENALLESASVVGGHLVLVYLQRASNQIQIHDLEGRFIRRLELPALCTTSQLLGQPDQDEAFFGVTTFTSPLQVYRTQLSDGRVEPWSGISLPIDPSGLVTEQHGYTSRDGTPVSLFLVRPKTAPRDGRLPILLYGYGGFSVSLGPSFREEHYAWLEQGCGLAVPNLRGGAEYGERWHQAGCLTQKENVFDDFEAAAEYLIREGYTSRERLAIRGGSNGGLLVGAVMTRRPELCAAVVCEVPLLDMVRYTFTGAGPYWVSEYGDIHDEEAFRVLHRYSPYHRVVPGTLYPPVLFCSADSDDRVHPSHARKMAARLQAEADPRHPVLLRIEAHAGHGGADKAGQAADKSADVLAFLLHALGVEAP